MSVGAAEPVPQDGDAIELPANPRRRKLAIIVAAAVVAVAGLGGAATVFVKKKRAATEAAAAANASSGDDGEPVPLAQPTPSAAKAAAHKGPPTFLPLDPFVVNLADRDTERFAQVGITLELDDAKFADQLKVYMPAIRNGILMALASKASKELLTRPGKEKLALEIMRESVRPLGIELEDDGDDAAAAPAREDGKPARTPIEESPVRHVHFSSFIIQ